MKIKDISGIGTHWWFEIFDTTDTKADVIEDHIRSVISEFENAYSRFKENSLVSVLNEERTLDPPPAEFVHILEYGKELYVRTDGIFNMLLGHVLENRGYDKEYSFTHKNKSERIPNPENALKISSNNIQLTEGNLDLGGFGKGYLIDILTEALKSKFGLQYFLINGGGDIYVTSDNGSPVDIYLEHPFEKDTYIKKIGLQNQAFAASATNRRVWNDKATGKKYSHILNSNDLDEIPGSASFTTATSAKEADAFATVSTIMGKDSEKTINLCTKNTIGVALLNQNVLRKNRYFPELFE